MKVYINNIKSTWKIYKQGRWPKRSMNIYKYMLLYTVKYVKCKLTYTK